ncbi:MAG: hypothetical protein JWM50_494 [Microbacteriaceae bacterium]|jgi:hypothetical protein|nr:hypothetical protein [Microbacteriaceae bacterium]
MRKLAVAVAAALLLMGLGAAPASALTKGDGGLQVRIDGVLAEYPGGVQISATTVSWDGGAILLTFPSPYSQAIGTCATGSYCAFSSTNYSGTKLAFTGCSVGGTANSLAPLGASVRSVANARTSGTVRAMNGISVVHTLTANTGVGVNASALTNLSCTT